jgi:general secretion pathway protein D
MTYSSGCATFPWPSKTQSDSPEQRLQKAQILVNKDAENTDHRITLRQEKEIAIDELLSLAEKARLSGNFEQATTYYDRLLALEPANGQVEKLKFEVINEAKRLSKMNEAQALYEDKQYTKASEILREILLEKPDMMDAAQLQIKINMDSKQSKVRLPKLKPTSEKPITLELRDANIRVVFEALSRSTGINFVLDKDIKPDIKTTVFIKKMHIEDAIDMVLASNGLEKKVLSENSVLVFPNIPQKYKDYQDLMIRSFYLINSDAKQISALLKTMLKTKDIFIDERLNMVVMRDTPEIVRIAEKLVQANDMADAEVMLDIEVLEVSRSRLQNLGIIYPNQLAVIGEGLTLQALRNLTSTNVGVSPNPALNFKKTTGDVNLLSNPRIRVKNNEKAKVLVGDKVPIITTTSTANVGVSENVTYVDVGLRLDIEPRINLDNYVNIKVGLEVSSLGDKTTTNQGLVAYTIGTRNANTTLRLKHGETQILAGLILDDERKTRNGLPGLGDIPILGRLFSNQEDKKSKTEIVLAITPRILNNIYLPKADIVEYWSGTESLILDYPKISVPANNMGQKLTLDRMMQPNLIGTQSPVSEAKTSMTQDPRNVSNDEPQSTVQLPNDLPPPESTLGKEKLIANEIETSSQGNKSTKLNDTPARILESLELIKERQRTFNDDKNYSFQ